MAENSKISWCTHTFNPWIGCSKVSPGCKFCYAENLMDKRFSAVKWGPGNPRKRTKPANWFKVRKWNRQAQESGNRDRVFCASLSDVFDAEVVQSWRNDLWSLLEECPSLDWLLLTKRPENIEEMVPDRWKTEGWPTNIWLGTTVENQKAADERIPILLQFPAVVRFLSCEPLLDVIDLSAYPEGIDWVIIGGESGDKARYMSPNWLSRLLLYCEDTGAVPFIKQMGTAYAKQEGWKDKKGGDIEEWPAFWPDEFKTRKFPTPQDRH